MQFPGETVEVPEIPWQPSVELPAQSSAVIVVDMQNDFVKEGGALMVPDAAATLDSLQKLLAGRPPRRCAYRLHPGQPLRRRSRMGDLAAPL